MIGRRHHRSALLVPAIAAALLTLGCAGRQHLDDYAFGGKTIALRYTNAPVPVLYSGNKINDLNPPFEAADRSPERIARSTLESTVQARFDTATSRMNFARVLAANVLDRATAALGAVPVREAGAADFVLDLDFERTAIQINRPQNPVFMIEASAVLRDARTGREVWRTSLHRGQGLAQFQRATGSTATIGPVELAHNMPVVEYHRLLETLAQYDAVQLTSPLGTPRSTALRTGGTASDAASQAAGLELAR